MNAELLEEVAARGLELPPRCMAFLQEAAQQPAQDAPSKTATHVIASAGLSLTAAAKAAQARGVTAWILSDAIEGEAREVAHMALLIGYGAAAINPYLAFQTIEELHGDGAVVSNVFTLPETVLFSFQGQRAVGAALTDIHMLMNVNLEPEFNVVAVRPSAITARSTTSSAGAPAARARRPAARIVCNA